MTALENLLRYFRISVFALSRFRYFEFWPMTLFYPPVLAYYIFQSLKHGSVKLPLYANPAFPNSGVVGESKSRILKLLAHDSASRLRFLPIDLSVRTTQQALRDAEGFQREHALSFPMILKPDIGQRGSGVRKVDDWQSLARYLCHARFPIILQEYCAWREEVGVNYVKYPGRSRGRIVGITRKRFPFVVGDGRSTLTELILADPRARLLAKIYLKRHALRASSILAKDERLKLVEAGNHCQGAVFENAPELSSPALEDAIERIARGIPGFYVGRFDLRFESAESLGRGEFKVIELNGAAGEATQIYGRGMPLRKAYRILFDQVRDLFVIGGMNGPMPTSFLKDLWRYRKTARSHPRTT